MLRAVDSFAACFQHLERSRIMGKYYVDVPFKHVDDLRWEYGNKFLVLADCGMDGYDWDNSGVLKVVCDTYRESLSASIALTTDETKMGEVRHHHFEYIRGVTKGEFKYP
jgi:hypothetical protein